MPESRREFLTGATRVLLVTGAAAAALDATKGTASADDRYKAFDHWWGMTIDIDKCVGCGNCVRACAKENSVPDGYFRTWVERYEVTEDRLHPDVSSPNGGKHGFPPGTAVDIRTFYVPKLCNHCVDSPCAQVCPVGATFDGPDGIVHGCWSSTSLGYMKPSTPCISSTSYLTLPSRSL
jgi:ferredoxin